MANKDSDTDKHFLSITEFARMVGMTVPALRHYDKNGVFFPEKRGEKFKNNYRLYSPTQIPVAKMIRVLTDLAVPLKEIRELAQSRTPGKILKLFSKHKDKVADEIRFLQDVNSIISAFVGLINEGISVTETDITVTEMPEKQIIMGGLNDFSGAESFMGEFMRFYNEPHEPEVNMSYPVGGYWTSMAAYIDAPSHPMRFFSIDPNGHEKREAGLYLNGYTRGYYGQANDLPERMEAFAKQNGLVFTGPVYNTYLFDEISIPEPDRYLLQASASVAETRRVASRRPHRRL
jgi:DNA-binding transcriptional MerR regulator